MTKYLDVKAVSRLIQSVGIEQILREIAAAIAEDFKRWNAFEKSARAACHSPQGVIEVMPIADDRLYAFKYVNGHPGNTAKGLPTVMAFGALADVATGMPLLLSEMTLVTALRTAATSALAAKNLARANSQCMAVIGCGAQSEFQILAFKAILGIKLFRIFDIDSNAMQKLRRNLSAITDIEIIDSYSVREAVTGADIITTLTAAKTRATILTPDMILPGTHINGIGGDCPGKTELDSKIVQSARVVVEYRPQSVVEGEIQQMPVDFPVTELWKILTGEEPGRQNNQQVTIFDSVGFALEDFSALRYLYERTQQTDIGTELDLIPKLDNPKDLYGILKGV